MGITPQALREHMRGLDKPSESAPKRHRERKLQNWTSDGSTDYDTSEEIEKMGPNYTAGRERFWRSLRRKVANGSRIR